MSKALLLAILALAHCVPAMADDAAKSPVVVRIKAVDRPNGLPVLAYVLRRDPINPQGLKLGGGDWQFEFTETDCSITTGYLVLPVHRTLYTIESDNWRMCQSGHEIVVKFSRTLDTKFGFVAYAAVGATQEQQPFDLNDPAIEPGLGIITQALESGDFGTASFISNEMNIALAAAGRTDLAANFRTLALAAGAEGASAALSSEYYDTSVALLTATAADGVPQLTPGAVASIEAYQRQIGLSEDGRLNWNTVRSMSQLASEDVERLNIYRREALQAIVR